MAESQGLLHSPTSGTYPPGLVWDTSCPILVLFLVAMQDILRGVIVAVQFGPTVRAGVPSDTEVFLDDAPTTTARLTCIIGSDFHDRATSLFRFIARHRDEGSPSCIQNTLVQATLSSGSVGNILLIFVLFRFRTRRHVVNVQVLEDQGPVGLDQGMRCFVQKVTATVTHFAIQSRQLLLGTPSTVTALLCAALIFSSICR